MPFALIGIMGWYSVPGAMIITLCFTGVFYGGLLQSQPFGFVGTVEPGAHDQRCCGDEAGNVDFLVIGDSLQKRFDQYNLFSLNFLKQLGGAVENERQLSAALQRRVADVETDIEEKIAFVKEFDKRWE